MFEPDEPGLELINVAPVAAPSHSLDQSIDLDESRVFDVRDLVTSAIEIHRGSQVRSRDVVQFVLLARPKRTPDEDFFGPRALTDQTGNTPPENNGATPSPGTDWIVPDTQTFHDLVNKAESYMANKRLPCLRAQKWANLWGRVGLIGLSAKKPDDIRIYRNIIEQLHDDKYCYTLFPREAVDKRGSISVLLHETFRALDPLCLPQILFAKNRGLGGTLKVTHIKSYGEAEKTRAGVSKKHWRLVLMQGCAAFMKTLEAFDDDHKFPIGSGHIYISGGARRPKTAPTQKRRPRPRAPPPGPDTRRGNLGGGNGGSTSGSNNNHHNTSTYERDFPRTSTGFGGNREGRGSNSSNLGAPRAGGGSGPGHRASVPSRRS